MELLFRAYDDGIAYRYYLPGEGEARVSQEVSAFNLPDGTGGWAFNLRNDYEGNYSYKSSTQFNTADFAMPVLASVNNNAYWVLLTEGNVFNANATYCASHLHGSNGQNMQLVFPPPAEQPGEVVSQYPLQTPYRVALITDNLDTLVNSNLVENLNPPTDMADTSWIKPGKAAWSWWSEERSPQWYTRQKEYVDFAARHGWEYVTVDAGWDDSWVQDICDYAASVNVDIFIWTDVGTLDTYDKIEEKLTLWDSWGAKGVKIDFMASDGQERMETYQMISEKAEELQLLINFHCSTKPAGEIRTWPHVITTEGVRGSEHFKWGDYPTAYHHCTLPFTRNVVGGIDYTPVVFSNTNRNTTHAHQLVLSVVFESGIQHFAESIDGYEAWAGTSFLDKVPVTWDETKVLEGFPGDYASIARRSGQDWFVGCITDQARTATVDCGFLPQGQYTAHIYKDGSASDIINIESQNITSGTVLQVPLASTGGCAILFTQDAFNPSVNDDPSFAYYEAESGALSGGALVYGSSNASGGQKAGNLGGSRGGSVQLVNVMAESAGLHEIKLFYAGNDNRRFRINVNGFLLGDWTAPNSGSFDTIRTMSVKGLLRQGANTITVSAPSGYSPDLDRIGVRPAVEYTEYHFEAENPANTLGGGAMVAQTSAASGGSKVIYIGMGGTLTFNNINITEAGTYLIRIQYLSGDNREVQLQVNNGSLQNVLCFDSGSFDKIEYKEALIQLQLGANTIKMLNENGYAPDIDKITLIKK
jgi:alpha-glucosidase